MQAQELRDRVASFERWHYLIDLGGGVVTPATPADIIGNRTVQRRRYFFDRLLCLTGGSLEGKRVLDLGCNAGYWSLQAVEAGAEFVFGIDGRQMHIDQANLVFEAKGIDVSRYRFEVGNFLDWPFEAFDVVLCLGVLYHVSSPADLFAIMARTGAELIVVDTTVSRMPGNAIQLFREPTDSYCNAIEDELVGYPTRGAVAMLADRFGYRSVPLAMDCITDFHGLHDYRGGSRVAFICSRTLSLDGLPAEELPRSLRPGVAGAVIRMGGRLRTRRS